MAPESIAAVLMAIIGVNLSDQTLLPKACDVRKGSSTEVRLPAWQVRSTLDNGNRQTALAWPFRANFGSEHIHSITDQ